jgi:hypothetical protein
MFEKLYPDARTAARHKEGPLAEDRIAFLADRTSQGYKTSTLRWLAAELLFVAQQLPVGRDQKVCLAQIEEVANRWPLGLTGAQGAAPTRAESCSDARR